MILYFYATARFFWNNACHPKVGPRAGDTGFGINDTHRKKDFRVTQKWALRCRGYRFWD